MLSRRILSSFPFSVIVLSALCESSSSISASFGAADDALLCLRRQRVPSRQIVQIFLHDHIAAARECRILLADERCVDHRLAARILGAIDEPQQVAVVEVTKATDLVDRGDCAGEACHDLHRHLEAKIHPFRADMKHQVPGVETA
jgi:hypothetical protein